MSRLDYTQHMAEDARLSIVKELAAQFDGRLNETMLTEALRILGYNKSRDWVRTQIRKLEELGAVTVTEAGTVLVPEITAAGLDHVLRRSVIEGIKRPSPGA